MADEMSLVLVVDDDPQLLKTAVLLMEGVYSVSVANSGQAAVKCLQTGLAPDLILLDVDMPDMDGYETLRRMQETLGQTSVPIVFLTGITDVESELQGLRLGAADYIHKPFSKQILLARIELHIQQGKRLREQEISRLVHEREQQIDGILTPVEQRIARLLAQGYTGKEIGRQLHYSYSYVKKCMASIRAKLDIGSMSELKRFLSQGQGL